MKVFVTGTVGDSLPPPYAGIPKHSLFLARLWKEMGHEVALSFIYRQGKEDDLGARGKYFFEYNKKPTKLSKGVFLAKFFIKNPYLYFKLLFGYLKIKGPFTRELVLYSAYGVFLDGIIREFCPDVIMAETALIKSYMATEVAKIRRIPIVLHTYAEVHDMTMTPNKLFKSSSDRDLFWFSFFKDVDLILAPSIYCAHGPKKYVPSEKIKIVYFGIDISKYLNFSETQIDSRKYFKLPENLFYSIAVGALTSRKGHDHLIKASAQLIKKGLPIGVIICGPGNSSDLKRLVGQEGISDNVYFFTGLSEEELIRLYKSADVYCDASNTPRACLGMSLTEGMIMKLPAVAYDAGGMAEVVKDCINGFLVPNNDIMTLSNALQKVYELSVGERENMGLEGLKIAQNMVDIKNESKRLIDELKLLNN